VPEAINHSFKNAMNSVNVPEVPEGLSRRAVKAGVFDLTRNLDAQIGTLKRLIDEEKNTNRVSYFHIVLPPINT
jgi:hypothetical protein